MCSSSDLVTNEGNKILGDCENRTECGKVTDVIWKKKSSYKDSEAMCFKFMEPKLTAMYFTSFV